MQWSEKQKIHMLSLLEGREERAEQRRKKLLLAKMARGAVDPKIRKFTSRFNLTADDMLSIFFSRIDPPNERGCMCWNHKLIRQYGSITFDNVPIRAHRLAWLIENGPIPTGMQVLHECDNPPCCNHRHLFLGTIQDNIADMDKKGRRVSLCGLDNPNTKLSPGEIISIREEFHFDKSPSQEKAERIALKYGVSAHRVLGIAHAIHATEVFDPRPLREPLPAGIRNRETAILSEAQSALLSVIPKSGEWFEVGRRFRTSTIKVLVEFGILEHRYLNGGLLTEVVSDGMVRLISR